MKSQPENISDGIDAVAKNSSRQLATRQRQNVFRSLLSASILLILIVPVLAVIAQAIRWRAGLDAGQWFSWPLLVALSFTVPVLWLMARTLSCNTHVDRLGALGRMDSALGASERIVTADQFLKSDTRDAFMQAAVEDSAEWVKRGRLASFDPTAGKIQLGRSLAAIPLAFLIVIVAAWMAGLTMPGDEPKDQPSGTPLVAALETTPEPRGFQPQPDEEEKIAPAQHGQRKVKPERSAKQKSAVANVAPEGAEESRGRLADGETSESQQTSNPSSARGEPSSQSQSSKSGEQTPRKPKKGQKQTTEQKRPQRPRDKQEEPSGVTAGQGSSRGSQNNAAASDWSSRSQEATPDDEDIEDEGEVDDEDEEQKSRGGVQPNMRDRRAPVNRDLQIGFGNGRPNPDANSRGGPGGQKKSRGVASLILGVPIPDRVNGQPNKGRIRVTQQRVTPEAEESDRVVAEQRDPRTGIVGPIYHPDLSPWIQDFIRRYFLARRKSAEPEARVPLQKPPVKSPKSKESNTPKS